ncbi:pyridoxamine 5'-phosphate oxidase family protein [Phenylobacterium sp.]|jgi:general stress protein 26|uniref:pyridoxamine 5'-phosphate oxidase family protein n=1 Tax=Phenylobacterium sp. TaxID=1871053 RepID=UPI002E2F75F7|nr:pyridoxamine 5'-phosphate oxidase family protein [Phenylobacterium sp.]HEX2559403.1 pyridoxamine 5'-phosphate oxidase family protein [Phenylobacterium sp.]
MADQREITEKFWKAVKSDRTVMLGLVGVEDGMSQPMTALLEDDAGGPLWIFSSKDTDLVQELGGASPALMHFSSKGHELFATVEGQLIADNDRAAIERLWNPYVAAWYQGGKDDPKLQLLRFEPEHAQIWLNENSLFAGVKTLLGRDPKKDYGDKVAEVRL